MTFVGVGRCFTFNYDQLLKLNTLTDGITLQLVPNNDYYIYLSEPDFNFITANPLTMPVTMVTLHGMEAGHLAVSLNVVGTEELNRLNAP